MTLTFTLPDLGEGLVDAEIVSWLVEVGDQVASDQPLVEVETAKATVQIPSPWAGTVLRLGGAVGEVLPVGALLVELSGDDPAGHRPAGHPAPSESGGRDAPAGAGGTPGGAPVGDGPTGTPSDGPRRRALASPSTRARATALGLDITAIGGTGPGGRVTRDDVERAARPPEPSSPAAPLRPGGTGAATGGGGDGAPGTGIPRVGDGDREVPLRGIRREIARTMTASWQQIPHVTEFREIDATQLVRAHRALRDRWPADRPRLTLLPLLAMACVAALRRHPALNASLDLQRETIRYHGPVHLGIATSSPEGLTVPVLRDADRMGLAEMSAGLAAAVDAARGRRARPEQLSGGTFTLTNFGTYGTWLGTPVINPPQAAIAGFGRVRDAVVAVDGRPVVRPTLPLAVSADHRIIDGDVLGAFVAEIAALITDPVLLFAGTA